MNVYLYRHANALDLEEDAKRPLSDKGLAQVGRMARFLKSHKSFHVDEIWHSPLLRAKETAVQFAEQANLEVPLRESVELEPYKSIENLVVSIIERNCDLLIVGHQPHLERLALGLLQGDPAWSLFNFKKGSVLALQYKQSLWQVKWMITSGLLK